MEISKKSNSQKYITLAAAFTIGLYLGSLLPKQETSKLENIAKEAPVIQKPKRRRRIRTLRPCSYKMLFYSNTLLYVEKNVGVSLTTPKTFEQIFELYKNTQIEFARIGYKKETIDELVEKGALKKDIKFFPTFIYLKKGKELFRVTGTNSNYVERLLKKHNLFPDYSNWKSIKKINSNWKSIQKTEPSNRDTEIF